jgi:Na+-transporting NADH:ubiquinone oxidoreductase subunit D
MKKFFTRLNYTKGFNVLKKGFWLENQVAIAVLGICSSLAITNKVENAIAMGLGVTFVVMASSALIAMIRRFIPSQVRMVTYMVIISTFTIIVQMFLQAYFFDLASQLGAYVGLIITNCIVMGRAEAFAVKNPVRYALVDGFASGMGYMIVLIAASTIREFLAFGSFLNMPLVNQATWVPWTIMTLAPGGFFVISLFVWWIRDRQQFVEGSEGK